VSNELWKRAQAWRAPERQVRRSWGKTSPTPRRPGSAGPPGTWT